MLPIINVNPGDISCIFSRLIFVIKQATELTITTPVLTLDHPLWIKANEIKYVKNMSTALIIGCFHNVTSYCGGVGTLMEASGLSESHKTSYEDVTVKHILRKSILFFKSSKHAFFDRSCNNEILDELIFPTFRRCWKKWRQNNQNGQWKNNTFWWWHHRLKVLKLEKQTFWIRS